VAADASTDAVESCVAAAIGPPSSSTVFFTCAPAAATQAAAGRVASRQGGGETRRSSTIFFTLSCRQQRLEAALRKPASRKISSMASAHCGTLSVLEQADVPGHQRGAAI